MRHRQSQNLSRRALGGAIGLLLASSTLAGATFNPGSVGLPGFPPNGGVFDPGGEIVFPDPTPIPPPPPPPDPDLLRKPSLSIGGRTGSALEARWCDRSGDADEGNHLYRRKGSGPYEFVRDLGTDPEDCPEGVLDEGLEADTLYCYQIFPVKFFSEFADLASVESCAYTRDASPRAVWRAQIEFRTASGPKDGTDDSIKVALNSRAPGLVTPPPVVRPFGNDTWTDRAKGLFRTPGSTDRFDLDLGSIDEMADITRIALFKDGGDSWCLDGMALLVNGERVYDEEFTPCLVAKDQGSFEVPFHSVSHADLRASAAWRDYQPSLVDDEVQAVLDLDAGKVVDILRIPRRELEERVEGIVGDAIHFEDAYFGALDGRRHVEAKRVDDRTMRVTLDLKADVDNFPNQEIDVSFDLVFDMACVGRSEDEGGGLFDQKLDPGLVVAGEQPAQPKIVFDIETRNFDVDASSGVVSKILAFILKGETGLEGRIEEKVREGFEPIAQQIVFETDSACVACQFGDPVAVVESGGAVQISIVPFRLDRSEDEGGGLFDQKLDPGLVPNPDPNAPSPLCECPGIIESRGLDFLCEDDPGMPGDPEPTPEPQPTPTPVGILTSALQLKDDVSPPINPDARRLVFRSTGSPSTPSGIVEPAFGSAGDPTTGGGAELVVYKVNGGPENVAEVALPATGWKRIGNDASPGYQYNDPQRLDGPIANVRVRNGNLTVRGNGDGLLELAAAPQGEVAVRLRLGTGDTWCAVAPAKPPTATNDTTARFNGQPGSPPPVTCPTIPGAEDSVMEAFLARPADLLG